MLLNYLDNLNINVNNDKLLKALISFKASAQKTKCGFTIGGFAPWNNFSLLQVKKLIIYRLIEQFLNFL